MMFADQVLAYIETEPVEITDEQLALRLDCL